MKPLDNYKILYCDNCKKEQKTIIVDSEDNINYKLKTLQNINCDVCNNNLGGIVIIAKYDIMNIQIWDKETK